MAYYRDEFLPPTEAGAEFVKDLLLDGWEIIEKTVITVGRRDYWFLRMKKEEETKVIDPDYVYRLLHDPVN